MRLPCTHRVCCHVLSIVPRLETSPRILEDVVGVGVLLFDDTRGLHGV